MKTITILVALSLLFVGCAVGSFPQFPDQIKNQYSVDIANEPQSQVLVSAIVNLNEIPAFDSGEVVRCLEFEIVSKRPYKIKYLQSVDLKTCNGLTGFKPPDAINIFNWVDDVYRWADSHSKCFK